MGWISRQWPARSPLALVLGTVLVGLTLTLVAAFLVQSREESLAAAELDQKAEHCRGLLQSRIDRVWDSFHLLCEFCRSTRGVDAAPFEVLAHHECERSVELCELAWVPRVPANRRGCFELQARASGLKDYEILEWDDTGNRIPAAQRPEYLPVLYTAGKPISDLSTGLDLAVAPDQVEVLNLARRFGLTTAGEPNVCSKWARTDRYITIAAPAQWVEPQADPMHPEPEQLQGYFVGVLRLSTLLQAGFDRAQAAGLDFLILDPQADPTNQFVCYHSTKPAGAVEGLLSEASFKALFPRQASLELGFQRWTVLFRLNPDSAPGLGEMRWLVLAAGVLCTVLSARLVHGMVRRTATVESLVAERTAALHQTQTRLENELTRLRQAEDQLRDSEQCLLRAQEAAGLAVWRWDWNPDRLSSSGQIWRFFGREPGEFEPTLENFLRCTPEAEHERLRELLSQARAVRAIRPFEFRILWPDRQERIARATLDFIRDRQEVATGVVGTLLDITASKRAEAELRRQSEEYWRLFSLAPGLIVYKDLQGRIARINHSAAVVFGLPEAQIQGLTMADLGIPEATALGQDDQWVITTGQPIYGVIEPLHHASGHTVWLKTDKVPYRDSTGRIVGVAIFAQDITEQRAAQEELRRRNVQLSMLNTMTSALGNSLALGQVFGALRAQLCIHLGVAAGVITTYTPEGELTIQSGWGLSAELLEKLREELRRLGPPYVPIELPPPAPSSNQSQPPIRWRIPLIAQGEIIGSIELIHGAMYSVSPLRADFFHSLGLTAGAAVQNALLFKQLQESHQRLRNLSLQLLEVQEKERRFLGHELHDQIGQLLTALKLQLEASHETKVSRQAMAILDELVNGVRRLSLDLRPTMLDDLGLVPAVLWLLERFTTPGSPKLQFEHSGVEQRFAPPLENAVFRILQEALTNALRHAQAGKIVVRLWAHETGLGLQVQDDGKGFEPQTVLKANRSTGLSGIQERVRLLGGELTIDAVPGAGTRLMIELPLNVDQASKRLL